MHRPSRTVRAPSRRQTSRFARRPSPRKRFAWAWALMVLLAIAAAAAMLLRDGVSPSFAAPFAARHAPSAADRESARFAPCGGAKRTTCVVDGDTFWYRGDKIRIADINAPEVSEPRCAAEAELGQRATQRLVDLLNQGAFTLASGDRATDRYGRSLRVVTRGGESIGAALEAEGLAEPWRGHRRDWCDGQK